MNTVFMDDEIEIKMLFAYVSERRESDRFFGPFIESKTPKLEFVPR